MNKTINQYINQLHLDPKREAAVRKLIQSVSQSSGGNSGGSNTPEPEFVDLGLPSGTLWCSCNLGANSPEEYGNFYQWGDNKPYHIDMNTGNMVDEEMHPINIIDDVELCAIYTHAKEYDNTEKYAPIYFKYNALEYYGDVDFKFKLDTWDDVAKQFNSNWRTPSPEEIQELIDYTEIINSPNINAPSTFILKSFVNGKTISFRSLPYDYGKNGRPLCWSNQLGSSNHQGQANAACCLAYSDATSLYMDNKYSYGDFYRHVLYPVRPVKNGNLNNSNYIKINGISEGNVDYETFTKITYALMNNIPIFDISWNSFIIGNYRGKYNSQGFISLQTYQGYNKFPSLVKYNIDKDGNCTQETES